MELSRLGTHRTETMLQGALPQLPPSSLGLRSNQVITNARVYFGLSVVLHWPKCQHHVVLITVTCGKFEIGEHKSPSFVLLPDHFPHMSFVFPDVLGSAGLF